LLAVVAAACADVVELKSGWKAEGEVTEAEDAVTVRLKGGRTVSYPRSEVERIVRQETPQQAFEKKFEAVNRNDLKALQNLASWCRVNGLGPEAVKCAERMLEIDPDSAFAKDIQIRYKMVVETVPHNRERDQALLALLGKGFALYHSRHYRIAYNTDEDYARERGRYFETLYEQFYRHFDRMGMPMRFLQDRVEVILFKSRDEYARYAAAKHPALARSGGFYSREDNRAAFFDGKGDAEFRVFQQQYAAYMRNLGNMRSRLSSLGRADRLVLTHGDGRQETLTRDEVKVRIKEMEQTAAKQWKDFQAERQQANLATTMHECSHQLAFNLGIHPDKTGVPKWLAEGIATFFEETEPERRAHHTGLNQRLLKVYRTRSNRPGLRDLLTDDRVWAIFDENTETAYGQGWALFFYLSARRPAEVVAYLRRQHEDADKPDTPERRLADFENAFGPLDQVERDWRAFVDAIPTQ
jgi:hypothetical protein